MIIGSKMNLKSRLSRTILIGSLVAVVGTFAIARSAPTQLDGGQFEIFQNGSKAGEIFVPARHPDEANYVEHWVLFSNYTYPGKDAELVTTIRAARRTYTSEAEFFARVPWGPGFRYVKVDSTDTDRLPGR
jgi:hypothetical protein